MITSEQIKEECVRPLIQVGSKLLDAERINRLNTADLLNLARITRRKDVSEKGLQRIRDLLPELLPSEKKFTYLSTATVLKIIVDLVRIRKFPPETIPEVNYILGLGIFVSIEGECQWAMSDPVSSAAVAMA